MESGVFLGGTGSIYCWLVPLKVGNSFADGVSGELGYAPNVQLFRDVLPVRFDGFFAYNHSGGNLGGATSFSYELENLPFSGREDGKDRGLFTKLFVNIFTDYLTQYRWAQVGIAGNYLMDGINQFLTGSFLHQVTAGTSLEHLHYRTSIHAHRQCDNLGTRSLGQDLTSCLTAVHTRHGGIHDNYVWFTGAYEINSAFTAIGLSHDVKFVIFFQKFAEAFPHTCLVIGKNYTDNHGEAFLAHKYVWKMLMWLALQVYPKTKN